MSATDDFWDDLLAHIRQQVLVPVVGPDLTVVDLGNSEQTLDTLVGQRLAESYQLNMSPGITTMGEAVAAALRKHGQDERLYRVINNIILELDPAPGKALRNLAAIDDLRLFVSTTPDRLLAQAVNEVRFQGEPTTRELTFSRGRSTLEQSRNAKAGGETDVVVLRLFGQVASTPDYAIHEEDRLEWIHDLLSGQASLPDELARLKNQPILFVGCEIPDWLGRFLLRLSSHDRLSLERKQFFFAGCSTSHQSSLSDFFETYSRKAQVQQLDMNPSAFVAELRTRWEKQAATMPRAALGTAAGRPVPDKGAIFISYAREDVDAARRLCDAIEDLGGDVWLDEHRLIPGDSWQGEILNAIRRKVRLFIPVISANTEQREEGYVFKEWRAAAERSLEMALRRRFIVPVGVDGDFDGDPCRYQGVPEGFLDLQFGCAPGGEPNAKLIDMLRTEIRAMRRKGAP